MSRHAVHLVGLALLATWALACAGGFTPDAADALSQAAGRLTPATVAGTYKTTNCPCPTYVGGAHHTNLDFGKATFTSDSSVRWVIQSTSSGYKNTGKDYVPFTETHTDTLDGTFVVASMTVMVTFTGGSPFAITFTNANAFERIASVVNTGSTTVHRYARQP